tara:strand:+ start:642 stop:1682 length:1041 start_codon:yes stop_codon:yes gene_type:complete
MTDIKHEILNKINSESKKITYTELYGNDVLFTLTAIIITIIISVYFIILINFKKYHKAWNDNENNIRCNPIYMPFSKYISTGPLFNKPISGSENLKYCIDNISKDISHDYDYDNGFTGIFKNLNSYYSLITDAISTIGLLLTTIKRLFLVLINVIMNRIGILSDTIITVIQKVMLTFTIFPFIFSVIWNVILGFINLIKYVLIYLVNLLYICVLGPIARLIQTMSIWNILLIVFFLIAILLFFGSLYPFGPWPFYLAASILLAVLAVILIPITLYVKLLFAIIFKVVLVVNAKVLAFVNLIDTGIPIDQGKYNRRRSNYIDKKEYEGSQKLFSTPSFNDCKQIFKN